MEKIDVKLLSDFELQNKYDFCLKQIANMKFNENLVVLFAELEDEINKRKEHRNGNLQSISPGDFK